MADCNRKQLLAACVILLVGLSLYYAPLLTNRCGPGGDGTRLIAYVEAADKSDSIFPLWNPHLLGGYPILADPEYHTSLGWLFDYDSRYFNLFLNIFILFLLFLVALTTYLLARQVGISHYGSICAALIMTGSMYVSVWAYLGRIGALYAHAATNMALACYLAYARGKRLSMLLWTGVFFGFVLAYAGYYILVILVPALAVTALFVNKGKNTLPGACLITAKHLCIISLFGVAVFAVFILPLADALTSNLVRFPPRGLLNGSDPLTVLNALFPLYRLDHKGIPRPVLFVSTLAVPLLVFLVFAKSKAASATVIFWVLCVFSLIFLLGGMYPFKLAVKAIAQTPVLNQVRQQSAFIYLFVFSVAFLCGFGFDAIDHRGKPAWKEYWVPLVAVCGLIALLLLLAILHFGWSEFSARAAWQFHHLAASGMSRTNVALILVLLLLLVPYTAFTDRRYVIAFLVVLCAVQVVCIRPPKYFHGFKNKQRYQQISRTLAEDRSYYRVWNAAGVGGQPVGMADVRKLNGFGYYFSNEHRWMLESLYGDRITALRPHWVVERSPTEWNMNVSRLVNIKYTLQPVGLAMPENWELVQTERKATLWRDRNWVNSLRIYDTWEVIPRVEETLARMRSPGWMPLEKIFTSSHPEITRGKDSCPMQWNVQILKYCDDEILLKTTSNQDGVLFLPEYYDKGWRATVDGRRTDVMRAFASFRAVALKAGTHEVRLYYSPTAFWVGGAISVISLLVLGLVSLTESRRSARANA